MKLRFLRLLLGVCVLGLAACSAPDKRTFSTPENVAALAKSIQALGPDVDPGEAMRAAEIAFSYTRELAISYEIVDPPLIHNTKVNLGIKPRGLCWHWAEDMEKRLSAEGFQTLDMQRAIASPDNPFRIDHSTALIVARGDPMEDGIVLDPWRFGGTLYWGAVAEDDRYDWRPRSVVLAEKWRRKQLRPQVPAEAG